MSIDLPTLTSTLEMLIMKLSDCDYKTLHITISLASVRAGGEMIVRPLLTDGARALELCGDCTY